MKKTTLIAILALAAASDAPLLAQTNLDDVAQLRERVTQLEKQVQDITQLLEPYKAQHAAEVRRKALREKFDKKMADDRSKYTQEQLREAEQLYQVANQKWGTPEATESLQKMIEKYPDINRTGCAILYVGQVSTGAERTKYLRQCIEKFNDCYYGDGVQVGVYARFLLANDYQRNGDKEHANALFEEIKSKYPDAVDHGGNLLTDAVKSAAN